MRRILMLCWALALAACGAATEAPRAPIARAPAEAARGLPALPPEALDTLALIRRGGPFPYHKDGSVFQNRERLLPQRPRGYYREYTVPTPAARDRGARRIIAGGQPPQVFYYTADHYRSFQRIDAAP